MVQLSTVTGTLCFRAVFKKIVLMIEDMLNYGEAFEYCRIDSKFSGHHVCDSSQRISKL